MSNSVEVRDAMEAAKRHADGIWELVGFMQESVNYPRDSFDLLLVAADKICEEMETALKLMKETEA